MLSDDGDRGYIVVRYKWDGPIASRIPRPGGLPVPDPPLSAFQRGAGTYAPARAAAASASASHQRLARRQAGHYRRTRLAVAAKTSQHGGAGGPAGKTRIRASDQQRRRPAASDRAPYALRRGCIAQPFARAPARAGFGRSRAIHGAAFFAPGAGQWP